MLLLKIICIFYIVVKWKQDIEARDVFNYGYFMNIFIFAFSLKFPK